MALDRTTILRAATALVDREGLAGLSMRKLGAELGVEAMSLYRYVDNKSDLLDGIFETVASEVELPAASGEWRADLRVAALRFYAALSRHPHALPLFAARPAATPAALRTLERALGLIGQSGASVAESLAAFNTLLAYIIGYAMLQTDQADVVVEYSRLDASVYPNVSQLRGVLDARDVAAEFERGLDTILDGLALRLVVRS